MLIFLEKKFLILLFTLIIFIENLNFVYKVALLLMIFLRI